MTFNSNDYQGGNGSGHFTMMDFVFGQQYGGGAIQSNFVNRYTSGAGYQFDNVAGGFPRNGLVWAFDFQDWGKAAGVTTTFASPPTNPVQGSIYDFTDASEYGTCSGGGSVNEPCQYSGAHWYPAGQYPFFVDRANGSAAVFGCTGTTYVAPLCGPGVNPPHGSALNQYGIQEIANTGYGGHFRTYTNEFATTQANSPMAGNSSYSVIMVMRYDGATKFSRTGGIWTTGTVTSQDNTMASLDQINGKLWFDWNQAFQPHYQVASSFTFPNTTNWYFIATTVQAAVGGDCAPVSIWVGQSGVAANTASPCNNTPGFNASSKTPNVSPGPLVLGLSGDNGVTVGESTSMTVASLIVYNRALTSFEIRRMYQSMKTKMTQRGITLQ
jgi:hypothetical protein